MLRIVILSVDGKPEIHVDGHLNRSEICRIVSRKFGYQSIHLPHSWLAFK